MALNIEINVTQSQDGESFYFQDATPLYNPVSAPRGYDPNFGAGFDPSNIDLATIKITITTPSGAVYVIPVTPAEVVIANIGTIGMVNKAITSANLGGSGDIEDGVYKFVYGFKDFNGASYSATCYVAALYQVCCCLDQKLKDLTICDNCTEKERSKKIYTLYDAWMLRQKAQHLVGCNDFAGAQKIIDHLSLICNIKRCDAC